MRHGSTVWLTSRVAHAVGCGARKARIAIGCPELAYAVEVKTLKPTELEAFLEGDPLVVDVRPAELTSQPAFPEALRIPVQDIQNGLHNLPQDRPILLLCERGLMSELAGLYLEAAGYTQVYNLEGGLRKLPKRAG